MMHIPKLSRTIISLQVLFIVGRWHEQAQTFIDNEKSTPTLVKQETRAQWLHQGNEHGQLPLHRALRNNVGHGSIKLLLLLKGMYNRSAPLIPTLMALFRCTWHWHVNIMPRVIM